MKVLVLNNDLMERTVIQQVLQRNKHEIVTAGDSKTAMQILQEGDIRFIIADRATTDIDDEQFIRKVRETKPSPYVYIILITPRVQDTDVALPHVGPDDYLYKPIIPAELKSRTHIGERLLGLGDDLAQAESALDSVAMFDPLTNMLNARAFLAIAYGEVDRARRNQAPLSLITVSINNFDEINAAHGEAVGNDVLTVISQVIREKSRPYDDPGHYEKALFLLPLPFVIVHDAEKVAERIAKGISNSDIALLDGTSVHVNTNIAIVSTSRVTPNMDMEMFIAKAKEILLRLKPLGGNQVDTVFI
jgi:diguanylate cyclase (GGDEF)-like protein